MMIPKVIQVYVSDERNSAIEVPITPNTTALDVIQLCREPGETACHLAELWRGNEREVSEGEKPYTILQQWGSYAPEVQFYLRHIAGSAGALMDRSSTWNNEQSMLNVNQGNLSLAELKDLAHQQQIQIERQQQSLVGKEQRLRFLRQQAQQQQALLGENDRLKRLREKAEAQEAKLKKIRAMRGKLDQRRSDNTTLSAELEAVRTLFEEKQNELTRAITKVDDLTKQLEQLKNHKLGAAPAQDDRQNQSVDKAPESGSELEKLKKELDFLNLMNNEQQRRLDEQRNALKKRNEDARDLDRQIEDLNDRLKKKKAVAGLPEDQYNTSGQSQAQQYTAPSTPMHTIVAAVEPLKQATERKAREEYDALHMKHRPAPEGTHRPGYPRQNTYSAPDTAANQKPALAKSASSDNLQGSNFAANRAAFEKKSQLPGESPKATVRPMVPGNGSPAAQPNSGINLFAYKQPPAPKTPSYLPSNVTVLPDGNIRYTQPPAGHPPPPYPNGSRSGESSTFEAVRRKFAHAPRPLKKRSSITEQERPQGPAIPKSIYEQIYKQADTPFYRPGGDQAPAAAHPDVPPPAYVPPTDVKSGPPPPAPVTSSTADYASASQQKNLRKITEAFSRMQEQPAPEEPPRVPADFDAGSDVSSGTGPTIVVPQLPFDKVPTKSNLKKPGFIPKGIRIRFDPLALLLDASLEGEFELVRDIIDRVPDPSGANDEGITALHNAVCAGHAELVRFLVHYGSDINAADTDGWTPLHCAASCNNLNMAKFLVENGACIFATTISDGETAADKCEELDDGYQQCFDYLVGIQEKFGMVNKGQVFALFDYDAAEDDELSFRDGDIMTILRRGDENESEWWWARKQDREGYIARNLLGMWPRIKPHRD